MRLKFLGAPSLWLAGCAGGQIDIPAGPLHGQAGAPALEYRSAFDGYRGFKEQELKDWRGANDEVGAAGGHGAHR